MPKIGATELIIILVIILLLFGANRIPQLAASLGKGIKEFRKAASTPEPEKKRAPRKKKAPPAAKAQPVPKRSSSQESRNNGG